MSVCESSTIAVGYICCSCLQTQVIEGIVQHRAVVVIVDSIAALARADFSSHAGGSGSGRQGMVDRQEALGLVSVLGTRGWELSLQMVWES